MRQSMWHNIFNCCNLVIMIIYLNCLRKSMAFYRGKEDYDQKAELQAIIERVAIEASSTSKLDFFGRLQILKSPAFLRPFISVGVTFILLNLSGMVICAGPYTATFLEVR